MGCSDSRPEDMTDLPDRAPETPPYNHPVIFTNNTQPEPPRESRRQLIPSLKEFQEVDDHARSVPNTVKLSPPTLVDYLVEPCKRDIDVVRVFYVWICTNISYDVDSFFGKKMPRNDPQSVLNTKLAVCQGYSELFATFCRLAKLPNRILEGFSKGFAYNPEKVLTTETETNHAWNVVFVQGGWRFIECTWGAGKMTREGKFEKKFSDQHFLMDPNKMINAHFPLMDCGEEKSAPWQLLRKPLTLEEFSERAKLMEAGLDWEVDLHPHRNFRLETDDEIEMLVRTKAVPLQDVGAKMYGKRARNMSNYVMIQRMPENVFKITIRPPASDKFLLTVFGRISPDEDGPYADLVEYMVHGIEIDDKVEPFPEQFGAWGVSEPGKHGLDESMKYATHYTSDTGRLSVPIRTTGDASFICKLSHAERMVKDAEDYILREFQKNLLVLHMRLPYKGFYTLKLYSKTKPEQKVFDHAANLLIENTEPADIGPFPTTFAETDNQRCILIEPGERDLPADTSTSFIIESPELQCAMIKYGEQSTKMENVKKFIWKATITTPSKQFEKIAIYGSSTPNKYLPLFTFRTEATPPPSEPPITQPRIDTSVPITPSLPATRNTSKSRPETNQTGRTLNDETPEYNPEYPEFPSKKIRGSVMSLPSIGE